MGLNTLFVYFVGNNWQNVANMYASLFGPVWPRIYFTMWYIMAQFILLNLIIAFVMEIYLYQANRLQAAYLRRAAIVRLYANFKENLQVTAPRQDRLADVLKRLISQKLQEAEKLKEFYSIPQREGENIGNYVTRLETMDDGIE